MDDLDQNILTALRRDGRASFSDLALGLGVTRATVRARVERMQRSGQIQGFSVLTKADLNHAPVRGLMMLGIEGPGAERIRGQLLGRAAVRAVHATNGKWDLIVELATDTLEALDRELEAIRKLNGVAISETSLLLSTRRGRG